MNPQEITEFFRKHGCTKTFRIIDMPNFNVFFIEDTFGLSPNITVQVKNVSVETEWIGNIHNFIERHMKDNYSDIYIYEHQNFTKNMKYIRYHKEIPQKLINRMLKINKLNDRIKQNIQRRLSDNVI